MNIIEAASAGAGASVKLVANIAANLIAFIALLEFLNTFLSWMGDRVGVEDLTFQVGCHHSNYIVTIISTLQFICSYVMWPFAFVMGTETSDCLKLGRMIGIKTFFNEYLAYEDLGHFVKNKQYFDTHISTGGNYSYFDDDIVLYHSDGSNSTLTEGILSVSI
jgi:pyrimidine nucleoside transport protein